jgi:hypothetical protein
MYTCLNKSVFTMFFKNADVLRKIYILSSYPSSLPLRKVSAIRQLCMVMRYIRLPTPYILLC